MFDSLDEQIKHDLKAQSTPRQRMMLWVAIAVASVAVFGGLYYGVSMIQ